MNAFDIVVVVLLSAAFAAVVGVEIYRRLKGKRGGCSCGCSGCSLCSEGKCRMRGKH